MTRLQAAEGRLRDLALEIVRRIRALPAPLTAEDHVQMESEYCRKWFFREARTFMDAADHFVALRAPDTDRKNDIALLPAPGWIRETPDDKACPHCGHLSSQHRTATNGENQDSCRGDVKQVDQNSLPAFANGHTWDWCPCEEGP